MRRRDSQSKNVSFKSDRIDEDEEDEAVIPPDLDNMTSVFLPKINYVTLMLGRETENSTHMESLALKYLKVRWW